SKELSLLITEAKGLNANSLSPQNRNLPLISIDGWLRNLWRCPAWCRSNQGNNQWHAQHGIFEERGLSVLWWRPRPNALFHAYPDQRPKCLSIEGSLAVRSRRPGIN